MAPAPPAAAVDLVLWLRRALHELADRLVPSETALFNYTIGLGRTHLVGALAELGVADALAGGPRTAEDLAAELGVDADTLHRVLRAAAAERLLKMDRRGRVRLARLGLPLRSDHRISMAQWSRYLTSEATARAWTGLPESVRTGEPAFPKVHGEDVWAWFAAHPDEERAFADGMRGLTEQVAPFLVAGWDLPSDGVVCDVAGGVGTLLAAMLDARPGLRGVLVESPGVLAEADRFLGARGLRSRVELVPGDIFAGFQATADVYVLKDIVHDWDDARSTEILRATRAAMPVGAEVVLVELLQERNRPDLIASLVDIQMLTQCDGGRQRSAAELAVLLRDAWFEPGRVTRTAGGALVRGTAV